MSAQAILAGQVAIEAKITGIQKSIANLGRLQKSMKQTAKNTSAMAKATKLARGALALLVGINVVQRNISKFAQALMATVDAMDQLDKASKRLGMTVQEFQQLSIATRMAGVEFEQLQTGFAAMQRNIGMFAMGTGEAKVAFEQLGITMSDLRGKSAMDQFGVITDKLNEFAEPAERASLAMKIFGEGGMKMLPFLNQGSAGFNELTSNVRTLTGELDAGVVESMVEIKDLLTVFGEARQMAQANFFAQFTDIIRFFTLALISASQALRGIDFSGLFGGVMDFNMDMETMKDTAKQVAAGILTFAAAMRTLASIFATFMMVGSALANVVAVIAHAFAQLIYTVSLGNLGQDMIDTTKAFADATGILTQSSASIVGSTLPDLATIMGSINTVHDNIDNNAESIWNAWQNTRKETEASRNASRLLAGDTEEAKDNVVEMRKNLERFQGQAIQFGSLEAEQKIQQNIENTKMLRALTMIEANTRNQIQIETY
jgi:hypothetical protein